MKTFKKILSAIGWTLVVCLAIVCGTITFKTIDPFKDNESIPSSLRNFATTDFFGFQPYTILSDSMKPEFEAGDVILTWLVEDKDDIKVGDVYTYTIGNPEDRNIIVHRVKALNEDGTYTFQGDNNNTEDLSTVERTQFQAKYFARIPKLGYVINFINKYIYFVIGFLFIYTLYVLFFSNDDEDEDEDDYEDEFEDVSEIEKADEYAFDKPVVAEEVRPIQEEIPNNEINSSENEFEDEEFELNTPVEKIHTEIKDEALVKPVETVINDLDDESPEKPVEEEFKL